VDRSLPLHLLLIVRARRALARTFTRRAVVALAAVVTALAVGSAFRSAEQTRSRWADTRRVAVAERDLAPGDVVDAGAVALRDLPRAAVAGAATEVVPLGAVVRYPIAAGEPLVGGRLAPDGLTGVAALVPGGHRAVAVPAGPAGTPPLAVGDRVDVVALTPTAPHIERSTDPEPEPEGEPKDAELAEPTAPTNATLLADQALVVDVADTAVTIAVPTSLAPTVAYGATQGLIALTLVGA
jgi:Flp pilus assembly protein CpaB